MWTMLHLVNLVNLLWTELRREQKQSLKQLVIKQRMNEIME